VSEAFNWYIDFTSGDCIFACATDDPVTSINTSVTAYYGLVGSLDTLQSTETNAQVTVNNAFKFSGNNDEVCLSIPFLIGD